MGLADNLATMMEGDIAYAITDVSSTLIVGRHSVLGTCGTISDGDNLDPDGVLQTADIEFVATKGAFGTDIPAVRSVVVVDGRRYYVEGRTDDGAAITLRLKRGP